MSKSKHYDKKYFKWQSSIGEFGGWANKSKFSEFISKEDSVLDFGCGGGYLLCNLDCKEKHGIEINDSAIEIAKKNGVEVYTSVKELRDEYYDLIISNHALEHTFSPLNELKELYLKLKNGGKIIFVVPCECISYSYKPADINNHLYSWSPMCLGNIFNEAGFQVIESKPYIHKWPPKYQFIAKLGGRALFDLFCKIYARLERSYFQVRVIAKK